MQPHDPQLQESLKGVIFSLQDQVDVRTGLMQYMGTGAWSERTEDKAWIDYLLGNLEWNRQGQLIKGSCAEYENTLS